MNLAYCNGVFHHIPLVERSAAVACVNRALRAGGLFALWENNPWNPGTRYVMAHCDFDRDAITLTPPGAGVCNAAATSAYRFSVCFSAGAPSPASVGRFSVPLTLGCAVPSAMPQTLLGGATTELAKRSKVRNIRWLIASNFTGNPR